ncbi:MAG: class I SAM-dependent methyltransferase [Candidatus Hodarchaeales archaeon]|jgi:ubiquinone/menaquinone biosynthesis C-methylase UbiE
MKSSTSLPSRSNNQKEGKFDLHHLEEKLMISPFKKILFKYFEFRIFKRLLYSLNINLHGKQLLEGGCGAGYGIEVISQYFKPSKYYAFDLNKEMVARSQTKVKNKGLSAKVFQGDVTSIPFPEEKFDVVFIFTVLHHEKNWRVALKEINRVLKPNGLLLINEINNRSLNWFERYLKVYHPKSARFTWKMFRKELVQAGFSILGEYLFLQDFGFFIGRKNDIEKHSK